MNADQYAAVAHAYQQSGHYAQAIENAEAALSLDPAHPTARVVLGWSQLLDGRYQEALTTAHARLAAAPDDVGSLQLLAHTHDHLNDSAQAVRAIDHALTVQPQNASLHVTRANLTAEIQPAWALASAYRAIELAPEDAGAHVASARALIKLRELRHARTALNRALALEPDNEAALRLLSIVDGVRGRLLSGTRRLMHAGMVDPTNEALPLVARIIVRRGIGMAFGYLWLVAVVGGLIAASTRDPTPAPSAVRIVAGIGLSGLALIVTWVLRTLPDNARRLLLRTARRDVDSVARAAAVATQALLMTTALATGGMGPLVAIMSWTVVALIGYRLIRFLVMVVRS